MSDTDPMYKDRSDQNRTYFDRLQAYSLSQAAVTQQGYNTYQGQGMPTDMSYLQRMRMLNDNRFTETTDDSPSNYRRIIAREQDVYRERLHDSLTRYTSEAVMSMPFGSSLVGLALGAAVPYAAMNPLSKYRERQQEQRYLGYQFANSIDTFADRIGAKDFSFSQSNQLGAQLRDYSQANRNSFFGSNDLVRMGNIANANGLINMGRGAEGTGVEGQTKEYMKQFEQLRKNTELVVKTLKTTMEGGLKVIKDMKAMGVADSQIGSYVGQLNTMAKASGMSYTGYQTLGGVGAQLAQQSGFNGVVGMASIQTAAMQLNQQNAYDPRMARAISNVGGVANAAAIVTQSNMAFVNTPVGTKIMAAVMGRRNAETGQVDFDTSALNRMISGKMSAEETTNRANAYGQRVGAPGRYMSKFELPEAYASLNYDQREDMMRGYVKMFGNSYMRQGTRREKTFAALESLGITDPGQLRLEAEHMLHPDDKTLYTAVNWANQMGQQSQGQRGRDHRGMFNGALNQMIYGAVAGESDYIYNTMGVAAAPIMGAYDLYHKARRGLSKANQWLSNPADWGTLGTDRSDLVSYQEAAYRTAGLTRASYDDEITAARSISGNSPTAKALRQVYSGDKITAASASDMLSGSRAGIDLGWAKQTLAEQNNTITDVDRLLASPGNMVQNLKAMNNTNLKTMLGGEFFGQSDTDIAKKLSALAPYLSAKGQAQDVDMAKKYKMVNGVSAYQDYRPNSIIQAGLNDQVKNFLNSKPTMSESELLNQAYGLSGDWESAKGAVYNAMGKDKLVGHAMSMAKGRDYSALYSLQDQAKSDMYAAITGFKTSTGTNTINQANGVNSFINRQLESGGTSGSIAAGLKQNYGAFMGSLSKSDIQKLSDAIEKNTEAHKNVSNIGAMERTQNQVERRLSGTNLSGDLQGRLASFLTSSGANGGKFTRQELSQINGIAKDMGIDAKATLGKNGNLIAGSDFISGFVNNASASATTQMGTMAGMIQAGASSQYTALRGDIAKSLGFEYNKAGEITGPGGIKLSQADQDLDSTRINSILGDAENIKAGGSKWGLNPATGKPYDINLSKYTDTLKQNMYQAQNLSALQSMANAMSGQSQGSQGSGQLNSTVSSPVTNYWNNNWSFSGR